VTVNIVPGGATGSGEPKRGELGIAFAAAGEKSCGYDLTDIALGVPKKAGSLV
jgi:hypothetical protein